MKLFGRKKIYKEIEECELKLQGHPDDLYLIKKLGDLYIQVNDRKRAAEHYVKVGDFYRGKGFYPKAVALYAQAKKIVPEWEDPFEKLADVYKIQGFSKEASLQYKHLADLMEKSGNREKAFLYMEKATELILAQKKIRQKISSFEVREKNRLAEPSRFYIPKAQKEGTEAFSLGEELEKEMESLSVDETKLDVTDSTGMQSVFKAISDDKAKEEPDDPLFLYNMGLAYKETGFLDEAIETLKRLVSLEQGGKIFDAYMTLGIALREKGLFDEALENLKKGALLKDISLDMRSGIFYEIAQIYKEIGDESRSFSILQELQKEVKDFAVIEKIVGILPKAG